MLALTKILVDSLNEQELNKLIPAADNASIKGSIALLERALVACHVQGYDEHTKFLRNLQTLRSSGTAHRKGTNYQKIARTFGLESRTLRSAFHGILTKGVLFLEFLNRTVESGGLAPRTQPRI